MKDITFNIFSNLFVAENYKCSCGAPMKRINNSNVYVCTGIHEDGTPCENYMLIH